MKYTKHNVIVGDKKILVLLPEDMELGVLKDVVEHLKEEETIEGIKAVPDIERKKRFTMTEKHKKAIRAGLRRYYKTKGRRKVWTSGEENKLKKFRLEKMRCKEIAVRLGKTPEQVRNKIKYTTREQKDYILVAKEGHTPYSVLAERFNKKFGTNYTKSDIQKKYLQIRR